MTVNRVEASRDKVRRLLKELFQFDAQDLDFGLYRILNFRRREIERFIEKDLIEAVEAEFKEYAEAGMAELQKEIQKIKAEIIRDFGEETFDEQGQVVKHKDAPKIKEYVKKAEELKSAEVSEAQMNEVFNHVYEFFSRYYDKGDFIPKRRYGDREKYYVPYNGEEVVLHWATKDLYYVKTDEFFRNYHFKAGGYRVNFLIREAEVEVNNVVGENKYFVLCDSDFVKVDEEKKVVDVYFEWRALTDEEERKFGKRNVQDALVIDAIDRIFSKTSGSSVGGLLRVKENGEKTVLEKHLNNYVRRNTTDYFIHKNLKAFLERELEFYIKNEVVDLDELESLDEKSLRIARAKVKAIREISRKIIEFLAQIEDFQKMLFEKKKFVIGTEYVITLDKIKEYAGEEFLESIADDILKNTNQLEEWKELLGMEIKNKKDLVESQTFDGKEWKKLPLDTKHFGIGFKIRLLEALSERNNLDEILDGILIKSENWQALNLIINKWESKIKSVYIDPPYNTGSDNFLYKDNYQHSSWLSMMENRLTLARKLISEDGVLFINIGEEEHDNLTKLVKGVFGDTNYVNDLIWRKRAGGGNDSKFIAIEHDYIIITSKHKERLNLGTLERDLSKYQKDDYGYYLIKPLNEPTLQDSPGLHYDITCPDGTILSGATHQWKVSKETFEEFLSRNSIIFENKEGKWIVKYKHYIEPDKGLLPASILYNNVGMNKDATQEMKSLGYDIAMIKNLRPKPSSLITYLLKFGSDGSSYVLDFFAGSGTTAHAVMQLNKEDGGKRKFILIEIADYFDNIAIPRIKKVAYSLNWKDGVPQDSDGTGVFFKYHTLEQYEDTLNNIVFLEKDKTVQETLDEFGDYLLKNMLEFETRSSPTRLIVEQFQAPFDYKIWVTIAGERSLATVDLVETFNYLLGITVEKFRSFKDQNREYRCVFGKLGQENIIIIWRSTREIDLKKDKEFVENTILAGTKPDRIFINGDSLVEKAEPIEPEFKKLMGA